MSKDFKEYFATKNEEVKEAFLGGYIAALKLHRVYDAALFLSGNELEVHVLGNLIAQNTRAENARRTHARMLMDEFKLTDDKKKELRNMMFAPEVTNDNNSGYTDLE